MADESVVFEGDTEYGHYQIADVIYSGRKARVLYSGNHQAAQSGIALDDKPDLLFDYNQRFIELMQGLRPRRVLLLGGGVFTLPKAINAVFPGTHLDIVELDPDLPDLARRYFDFRPNRHTKIHIGDGCQFLRETKETYDLIIIDVFEHAIVPAAFQTIEIARDLAKHLRSGGTVAQNIIASYHGARVVTLHRQLDALHAAFTNIQIFPAGRSTSLWLPQNFIVTAQNGDRDLQPYLRYEALNLPRF